MNAINADKIIPLREEKDFFSSLAQKIKAKIKLDGKTAELSAPPAEGQLSLDVGETADKLVIVATMAGAKPEDISINIHNDLLTIRGKREKEISVEEDDYFYKECYWGNFSRTIILPVDVLTDEAAATFKNGILTIILPKESARRKVPIKVIEE